MTDETYMKAHMIAPSQNKLLVTDEDFDNYELLCKYITLVGSMFIVSLHGKDSSCRSTKDKKMRDFKNESRKKLLPWIFMKTPLLDSMNFEVKLSTRLYWIANGLDNFPVCCRKDCQNKIGMHKNVISFVQGYHDHCSIKCVNEDKNVRDKIDNTKQLLYGDINFNNRPKNNITCMARYGMLNGGGTPIAHSKMHRKYFYDGQFFDSSPELAFYIWLKDNDIQFEFQPKTPFSYEHEQRTFNYFPDFKIDDMYFELKGDHFFNADGILFCPYRYKSQSNEQYKRINERYAMKHQCMLQNNVIILKSNEYQMFMCYVTQTYGKDYLKQFKMKKTNSQAHLKCK